ncbi:MAG: hypothetical protein JRE24_11950 [Deltaproteobacteria bacterium]|nr:hypothetical protein [Deltaproteobacteria bacterium]
MDECANNQYATARCRPEDQYATARCRPEAEADNRVVAEGEDGYFSGTTGLPVGLHRKPGQSYDLAIRRPMLVKLKIL